MDTAAPIPQEAIDQALNVLSTLVPAPLALYWEYQDAATTVLFVVNVLDQSEASVQHTYFAQVVQALSALIPETDDLPTWMVLFQDAGGHLITSCTAQDLGAPSNNSFKPKPLRGSA